MENTELVSPAKQNEQVSPEQLDKALQYVRYEQLALYDLIRLDIRNLLTMLTAHGTNENQRRQIRESIERAIIMSLDYGTNVLNPPLREHGALGKLESAFAAHLARCKENGMVLIANNMRLEQENQNGEMQNENKDETKQGE